MNQEQKAETFDLLRRFGSSSTLSAEPTHTGYQNEVRFSMDDFYPNHYFGRDDVLRSEPHNRRRSFIPSVTETTVAIPEPSRRKEHRGLEVTFLDDHPPDVVFGRSQPALEYHPRMAARGSLGNESVGTDIPNIQRISSITSHSSEAPRNTRRRSSLHDATSEVSRYLSGLYGMFMTIAGCSLSLATAVTHNLDNNFERWFDSLMMAIAILWLIFAFTYLFRQKTILKAANTGNHPTYRFVPNDIDSGSFYLKMGATVFAIGAMIYSCLEVANFLQNISCFSVVLILNPCLFVVFVLLQLYFIFKNSQFKITKFRALSRFGLMHMIALDLILWVRTLLDETLHEFVLIRKGLEKKLGSNYTEFAKYVDTDASSPNPDDFMEVSHLDDPPSIMSNVVCGDKDSVIHEIMESAAMFLFPCIIEYALITAGILYIMWQVIGASKPKPNEHDPALFKHPRLFALDCTNAANGLFAAIVLVVLTIVGLIVFFVFMNDYDLETDRYAALSAYIMDLILNVLGIVCVIYCAIQFTRKLHRVDIHHANMELDDGLLLITMVGVYSYIIFSLLGAIGTLDYLGVLTMISSILELAQTTFQTVFILDASRRVMFPPDNHSGRNTRNLGKPAREVITLLLAVNFAQWAIDIFCTMRADANPGARDYFGAHLYAIMLHITVPLVIFYRFHSTVCLFDIWKRAYKVPRTQHQKPASRRPSVSDATSPASVPRLARK